jgi:hypothetical protein
MATQTVEFQAKVYTYDLNNCARENGFKADEVWEVSLATDEDKTAIESKYYPTVWAKVSPEILSEMLGLVKEQLLQVKPNVEDVLDKKAILTNHLHYLIAFNPKRERRH